MIKNFTQITDSMKAFLKSFQPNIDTSEGTPVNDIVINAPSQEISVLYDELNTTQRAQALDTAGDSGVETMMLNQGGIRKSARYSRGTAYFFTFNEPISDVSIAAGTEIATVPTDGVSGISFVTTRAVIMYASLSTMYLNPDNGLYEIAVDIESVIAGTTSLVGPSTITNIKTPLNGVSGVYNALSTYGGADAETLERLRARVASARRGTNISTTDGILTEVLSNIYVEDAVVVGHQESDRDIFGAIDVYVRGKVLSQYTEVFEIYSGIESSRFTKSPVVEDGIISIVGDYDGPLDVSKYTLNIDTGSLAGSVNAVDTVSWSEEVDDNNSLVTVEYSYNGLIEELQSVFSQSNKDIQNSDLLVKWATEIGIDNTMDVKVFAGYNEEDIRSTISSAIATFYVDLRIGQEVQQADVAKAVLNVEGVDDLKLPFTLFQSEPYGEPPTIITPNDFGNLTIPNHAYAISNELIINIEIVTKPVS